MGTVMGRMWLRRLWEGCQPRNAKEQAMHSFGCWWALGRELERELGSVRVPGRAAPGGLAGEGTLWEREKSPVSPLNSTKKKHVF
jgi:hypothetical protein